MSVTPDLIESYTNYESDVSSLNDTGIVGEEY